MKTLLTVLLVVGLCLGASAVTEVAPVDEGRAAEIAAALPKKPGGPGRPISDRKYWRAMAKEPAYKSRLAVAEKLLTMPLPELPDSLYLEYSKNGNRTNYQSVNGERRNRLTPLVMAECMENKGRFVPAIEELVMAVCAEKSWVLPAHDKKLENFEGRNITIDLASSELAWQLAMADYLLGDKLKPEVRNRMRSEMRRRVLTPFEDMMNGKREQDWWMRGTNNWNPVCFAGVTGCALIEVKDARERARYIAAAEHYSSFFFKGFTPDGYCSEGLSYWNYGFGYFAAMAETFRLATDGAVDLLAMEGAKQPAKFAAKLEIVNNVYPAFADCPVSAKPTQPLMWLVDERMNLPMETGELETRATMRTLGILMVYNELAMRAAKGELAAIKTDAHGPAAEDALRSLFPDGGVYIGRPAQRVQAGDESSSEPVEFAVALKGGNNAEHHNHNDVGTYLVVVGDTQVLLDPGKEEYTARTFSSRRYESKLLNSYGHPVPVVAGKLQRKGAEAVGKVLKREFSPERDVIVMDISSAYEVPTLTKLHRTFTYVRGANPSFTVTDEVEFSKAETFETALITDGAFEKVGSDRLTVLQKDAAVEVAIEASGETEQHVDTIKEDAPVQPDRLGIKLKEPVTSATVTMRVTPLN